LFLPQPNLVSGKDLMSDTLQWEFLSANLYYNVE
jgi:hypothetical protein